MAQFKDVVTSIADIRKCLQIMTSETGASIEPQSQTQLIDAVASIKGVLGGVVPGAGGYDAICMLVASAKVDDIVATTREDTQRYSNVRWMDLTEQRDGLIEESPADFNGLLH
jgi:phosphomevalonate kinase